MSKKLVKLKSIFRSKSVVNLFFRKKKLIAKLINLLKLFRLRVGYLIMLNFSFHLFI